MSYQQVPLSDHGDFKTPKAQTPNDPGYVFSKTHTAYPQNSGREYLAEHLQFVYEELKGKGARGAAYRLAQLDQYAGQAAYDSSEILLRMNLDEVRSELDDVSSRWVRGWSWARNIFALLPLLLTWWALGTAASTYNAYYSFLQEHQLPNDPKSTIIPSFLVAWQSGFSTRGFPSQNAWPFSNVALLDFALLTIVVVLTFFTHWAEGRALKKAGARYQLVTQVVGEYLDALRTTKKEQDNRESPRQWADVIDRAMNRVATAAQEAAKTVAAAATTIGTFDTSAQTFFQNIDARITEMVEKTDASLSKTTTGLEGGLTKFTDKTNDLLESVKKVQESTKALQTIAESYTTMAGTLNKQIAGLEASQETIATKMSAAADSIGGVVTTFNSETLGALAEQVSNAAMSLGAALQVQQVTPTEFYEAAKELGASADQIRKQVELQQRWLQWLWQQLQSGQRGGRQRQQQQEQQYQQQQYQQQQQQQQQYQQQQQQQQYQQQQQQQQYQQPSAPPPIGEFGPEFVDDSRKRRTGPNWRERLAGLNPFRRRNQPEQGQQQPGQQQPGQQQPGQQQPGQQQQSQQQPGQQQQSQQQPGE